MTEDLQRLEQLADRARNGARPAVEELLRASLPIVHALARARLGDGAAAAGAATDALARVARGIGRLSRPAAYPAWLRKIVGRCAADALRAMPRAVAERLPPPVDPRPGPVDTLLAQERGQAVRAAVAALPRREREVVLLHFVESLSYREIARLVGVGLGSVARCMARAREALKRALEETQ